MDYLEFHRNPKPCTTNQPKTSAHTLRQKISLILGVPLMVFIIALPRPGELSPIGHKTLAVAILMAFWWITEALPLAATALIPLALFPLLGIMNYKEVAPNYGDSIIFLFMGGFFLAITMQSGICTNAHAPFLLMIPATISASCAFMLPVAMPPNAIIFGSGYLTIGDMAKAGLIINLIGAVLITMIFYGLILLEIIPATFPPWAQSA